MNNYFLTDHEKDFYIFSTDDLEDKDNLYKYHQEQYGWPYDSMFRYHFIKRIKIDLLKYDYIFLSNININPIKNIDSNILPGENNNFLVGCKHPGNYFWSPEDVPFESSPFSEFFISNRSHIYYQGCFVGGRTKEFLEMVEIITAKLDIDLSNDVMPIWFDESMLNWYLQKKNPLVLPSYYIHPEGWENIDGEPVMLQINKEKEISIQDLRSKNG
jgi:hypothetical protein